MAFSYVDVNPTLIPNTTMQKRLLDGVDYQYLITANDGYVLHDQKRDWTETDPDTEEEILVRGYTRGTATCAANYDFTANPREFYAVLENTVPENQIFGGGDNDHEVM